LDLFGLTYFRLFIVPDRFAVLLQYLLPKRGLTAFAGLIANAQAGRFTTYLISWFVGKYQVNMAEAANADIAHYTSFNAFFTRALRANARSIHSADFVCPVDGSISQFGRITDDMMFQAKGHQFSSTTLLGGDPALAAHYLNGSFANIYLSPRDYHRIHMPCDGRLIRMIYIPGDLFSVNPVTARGVPNLFARNERVVCVFETAHGLMSMVLVGATIVGSIATVWHGIVNPPRTAHLREWQYAEAHIHLKKGDEMGRFLLGSTVLILLPTNNLAFNPTWQPAAQVKMGSAMAELQEFR
jgi:phosphatidylserine decarboxylase